MKKKWGPVFKRKNKGWRRQLADFSIESTFKFLFKCSRDKVRSFLNKLCWLLFESSYVEIKISRNLTLKMSVIRFCVWTYMSYGFLVHADKGIILVNIRHWWIIIEIMILEQSFVKLRALKLLRCFLEIQVLETHYRKIWYTGGLWTMCRLRVPDS